MGKSLDAAKKKKRELEDMSSTFRETTTGLPNGRGNGHEGTQGQE
jgi:hypothetical protein